MGETPPRGRDGDPHRRRARHRDRVRPRGRGFAVASRTRLIDATVSAIRAAGGDAIGSACDVDDVFAANAKTVAEFGPVDILVNNAQGFGTERRPAGTPSI